MTTHPDGSWARGAPAVAVREAILTWVLGPVIGAYATRRVVGAEALAGVTAPVLFVANHASHMDAPVILRALPRAWRRRTAVVAAADYFFANRALAAAVSLAFNAVPVDRGNAGGPGAVSELDRLLDGRWSLVIFAEGTRSRDGTVGRLHAGAAVLAAQRGLAVVPVCVTGTHDVMPAGRRWMRWGRGRLLPRRRAVEVRFGPPVRPRNDEHRTEVMERVREFFDACGAVTTPDPRVRSPR